MNILVIENMLILSSSLNTITYSMSICSFLFKKVVKSFTRSKTASKAFKSFLGHLTRVMIERLAHRILHTIRPLGGSNVGEIILPKINEMVHMYVTCSNQLEIIFFLGISTWLMYEVYVTHHKTPLHTTSKSPRKRAKANSTEKFQLRVTSIAIWFVFIFGFILSIKYM